MIYRKRKIRKCFITYLIVVYKNNNILIYFVYGFSFRFIFYIKKKRNDNKLLSIYEMIDSKIYISLHCCRYIVSSMRNDLRSLSTENSDTVDKF